MIERITLAGNSHTLGANLGVVSAKPTCLILDEIDNFFETNKFSMKKLMNFLFEKRRVLEDEYAVVEQRKLRFKRPILFISEDMYQRGLRPLRSKALVLQLKKDKDLVVKKLKQISEKEVRF